MSLVLIRGSHGSLSVDAATGHIVERDLDGDEYATIAFFDRAPIARCGDHLDILAAGYWTVDGDHAEPLTIRFTSRRGEMTFDDWVPMRLLPPR